MTGLAQFDWSAAAALLPPVHPPAASSIAEGVDQLHYFLTAITLFFTVVIFGVIFYFMVRYRRRSPDEVPPPETEEHLPLEIAWTVIPALICVVIFVWASSLYVRNARPPAASSQIYVIGKQWMWHIQHPEGPREINELHVPVGVPVQVTMTSQDVIHDFYIPAFRVKKDVLPGRYSTLWFQPTEIGTYHLYCAQYCGALHSQMIGWVYVMSQADYATWLSKQTDNESMAQLGERLFTQLGCSDCHIAGGTGRGPSLVGLYGKSEKLKSGESRDVNDDLIREAIVNPNSIVLASYPPIMPTYKGQVNEEQVLQLIAYVKSLGAQERTNGK